MRYVIKSQAGGYFTEFEVLQTRAVTLNGVLLGHEHDLKPIFEALRPKQAAKFDTEADALAQLKNPNLFHGGPDAFSGCTVEPTED